MYNNHLKIKKIRIAVLGTVGIPARYGGFEALAENLVHYHSRVGNDASLTVWCSGKDNPNYFAKFESAQLRYVNLHANGPESFLYDVVSLVQAVIAKENRILLLGVSGALALPFIRLISRAKIITNIDGMEWKREKWNKIARLILRVSEWAAVRFSNEIIADNQAIADYIRLTYKTSCHVIGYGGDQAVNQAVEIKAPAGLPPKYALGLCRIEPENKVHIILDAISEVKLPTVFVGNWDNSHYGRELRQRYGQNPNMYLLDPIYEPRLLRAVRERAWIYLHGHSAGGTNPSLVEMMHFGIAVLAYQCTFNHHTTEGKARYFENAVELSTLLRTLKPDVAAKIGVDMRKIAQRKYTWDQIGEAYFGLLERV